VVDRAEGLLEFAGLLAVDVRVEQGEQVHAHQMLVDFGDQPGRGEDGGFGGVFTVGLELAAFVDDTRALKCYEKKEQSGYCKSGPRPFLCGTTEERNRGERKEEGRERTDPPVHGDGTCE